ncbi:hypothetical protein [Actinosynnema sp. NPDC020468]|uniref:hypothetical protein n=1 Tax=Actinosynnema sp. NPDC020468 TaxID=3154488 RepID=UPI003404A1B7
MSAVDRESTGARRVRRLLTRALLVAGGTLAGTAALWSLSTGAADAEEVDRGDAVTSLTGSILAANPLGEALAPVDQAVRDLDTTLRAQQEKVRKVAQPDLGQVTAGLTDAVTTWLQPLQAQPAEQSSGTVVVVVPEQFADAAPVVPQQAPEAVPAPVAEPVEAGTPVVQGAFAEFSESWTSATRQPVTTELPTYHRDSFPGGPSGTPFLPPVPPVGAPAHCTCGGDGSGNPSGGTTFFTTYASARTASASARALFPADERNAVAPGKQPGTTPD